MITIIAETPLQQRYKNSLHLKKINKVLLQPMKLFTLIMAFVVFFASITPCADSVGAVKDNRTVELSTNHQSSSPGDMDFCSPFCICACCAGFVYNPNLYQISEVTAPYNPIKEAFINADISSISLPIWQPPQLLS